MFRGYLKCYLVHINEVRRLARFLLYCVVEMIMNNFRVLFSLIIIFFIFFLLVTVNNDDFENPYVTKVHVNIFSICLIFLVLFPDFFSFVFFLGGIILYFFCNSIVAQLYSISIVILGTMNFIFAHRFFYLSTGYHYYCPNCKQYLGANIRQCPLCGTTKIHKVIYNRLFYFIYILKRKIYYVSY